MNNKVGRNDPCPCGSGKKYKSCCLQKQSTGGSRPKRALTAKWINAPQGPNLMERTFGDAIASSGKSFQKSHELPPSEENTEKQ